ncbi:MAG: TRAP transporter small permease [Rhodocyclaceae bacterium]|nr:TRAP transporter small permease [Rhodocyclaceae bacterium]
MDFRTALHRASDRVNGWVETLLLLAGIVISVVLFLQVVARYAGHSLSWSEEVGRYLLVAITFLGATVAYKRASFVGLKGFGAKLGPFAEEGIVRLLQLMTLACFAFITWFGARYAFNAWEQSSTAVQMPMSIPLSVIPLSGLVFLLHAANDILRRRTIP